jgi:Ca2+-binding EF-hand superfamily protein
VIDALILLDLDADGDRRITLSEVEQRAGALFSKADANGDGQIGGIELRAFGEAVGGTAEAAPLLVAMDRNGDGAVRPDEFRQYYAERLNGLDDDDTGVVTRAELIEEIAPPSRPRPEVVREP